MKIFYLEDDEQLSETVIEFLEDEGFEVVHSFDGDDALTKLYNDTFNLLLLDVNVPNIDGFSLLESLRNSHIKTPAIFITSLNSIDDLSRGYEIGADDYIKKPFVLKELLFRIKALLKREYKVQENLIQIDENIVLDITKREIQDNDSSISINEKEMKLLVLLVSNKNRCVTFDEIFENVWSFSETHSDQSLRTFIKNLRKIIGKEKIVSIKKQGYMFV